MVERRKTPASRSGSYRPGLVAAGIGLLFSFAAAYAVARWERRGTWIEFEGVAATQLIEMQNGVNEYLARLVTLRTLFESANEEVTRSEFEVFGSRLFENHPGVLRVGWLPKIYRKERAEYRGRGRHRRRCRPIISNRSRMERLSVAPESEFYFPVFFSTEPKTSPVYGMDYSTDPVRWATLERARDNDEVAVAPPRLFKDVKGGTHGVLVGVPVYVKGTSRTTIADRRRNLYGFVVGIFDLAQLLQSIRWLTAGSPPSSSTPTPLRAMMAGARSRLFVGARRRRRRCRLSRTGRTGPARSESAMRTGKCGPFLPAAVDLFRHYDRALTILDLGLCHHHVSWPSTSAWRAATRAQLALGKPPRAGARADRYSDRTSEPGILSGAVEGRRFRV